MTSRTRLSALPALYAAALVASCMRMAVLPEPFSPKTMEVLGRLNSPAILS